MWITRWLDYTAENEAPEIFHYWCAIAILGHALNRRVWLDQFYDTLYPGQIMVLLVSDSAVSRKTTAIITAQKMLMHLPELAVNVIDGKVSNATLIDAMYRVNPETLEVLDSIGFIVADEMGSFVTRESWAETLVTDITALNTKTEVPFRRRMRSRDVELVNVCLGALMGTTPTGLAYEIPKAAQTAGFLGRLLTVYSDDTERVNALVEPPKKMKLTYTWLVKDLYRIANMTGPFAFTEDGAAFYKQWYFKYRKTAPAMGDERTGFYGRMHSHVLRVAMVLSAARDSERKLDAATIQAAVQSVEYLRSGMSHAYRKMNNTNPLQMAQERILSELTQAGGRMTKSQLYNKCYTKTGPAHIPAMAALVEAGVVREMRVPTKTKPVIWLSLVRSKGELLAAAKDEEPAIVEEFNDEESL